MPPSKKYTQKPGVTTRRCSAMLSEQTSASTTKQQQQESKKPDTVGGRGRSNQSSSLAEAKKQGKQKMSEMSAAKRRQSEESAIKDQQLQDIYQNAISSSERQRFATGVVYDDRFVLHRCLWDPNYPECPERYLEVMKRVELEQLIDRCTFVRPRLATEEEIRLKHTQQLLETLKATRGSLDKVQLEDLSSRYDAIFIHPGSYETSLLSVGSTVALVEAVCKGEIQNGMAIVRPPGHHAMTAEFNGYCFFNNVAIAAQHALDKLGLSRILIVDWDVHHGQGTQRMFYSDPRVLYFSVHRYQHATFWPNLRESDFDFVGSGKGEGFNFNVPLNEIGMENADYLAIWHQLLLPVATEFNPELIIISAGYDAAFGCPEGMMNITPAFYAHLLSPLLSLAQGRVAVVLEGGYCLESLAEASMHTLKTLLGDPCSKLADKLTAPCASIRETILNCIASHRNFWKSLQLNELYNVEDYNNVTPQENFHKLPEYRFEPEPPRSGEVRYETRNCYPVQSVEERKRIHERLVQLRLATDLSFPVDRLCYVYDETMLEHQNSSDALHPENPARIANIYRSLTEDYQLTKRMKRIAAIPATLDELCLVHDREIVERMHLIGKDVTGLKELANSYNSVYLHPKTFTSAAMAAGSVIQVVDEVMSGRSRAGLCIVRPPGHHAEPSEPHGFCIFNNVAVAARVALEQHNLQRVLIVDWDVHHGNGTQHIFEEDPRVLYISVHRYDNGTFFPRSTDGNYTKVGHGKGTGFTVNVPWNYKSMGDAEYMAAFSSVILPIAYEFDPELVLVSAGFDAAIGDPLGGCRVTPEAYGYFTQWLSSLAGGRVIVCLEGGYNVNTISHAMAMCAKALLGDPLPMLQAITPQHQSAIVTASCYETLRNVIAVQSKHWSALCFGNQKLPNFRSNFELSAMLKNISLSEPGDGGDSNDGANRTSSSTASGSGGTGDGPSRAASSAPKQTLTEFLRENMQALENEEMFAIVPKKDCPHLKLLQPETIPLTIDLTAPCTNCDSRAENWMCLICYGIYCGRYVGQHMVRHSTDTPNHPIALSFSDLSVWCYDCDSYIDHAALHPYKTLVHMVKFSEPFHWAYGSNLSLEVVRSEDGAGDAQPRPSRSTD
ncbi:histone deacetylase 6 isoform X1 [Anopheles darlingi]|uniref:histone deacetylase 6 isoform X1 n=1 Tax=Anopheles darlingi TaxID=43151 RepID=UPI0021001C21|nr:histone deacetylase 6 isoform X1 [Anopheles darlingi]